MSDVLIVDWLGRGGIAQCSYAWAVGLARPEVDGSPSTEIARRVTVVTRRGRDLDVAAGVDVKTVENRLHPLVAHRRVVAKAARIIRATRPTVVVLQNYIVPPLERPVVAAAVEVGARLILVLHDHRLHDGTAGTTFGLRKLIRQMDLIVCHTEFVAHGVASLTCRRDIEVLPHPAPALWLDQPPGPAAVAPEEGTRLALHFGMLGKRYKGTDRVQRLAARGVQGWSFAIVGPGAPTASRGAVTVRGYLSTNGLVNSVRASDATLLPYSFATQSGAVVLAQACGSVVVAHRVGGIPEQVTDQVTGMLLPSDATDADWFKVLISLDDPDLRTAIVDRARRLVATNQAGFTRGIRRLVS